MSTDAQIAQESAPIEPFDPTAVLDRLGGNPQLFAELVELFLEDYPLLVADIRHAVARHDCANLHYAAHTLRGAIGNFTVSTAYQIAKVLESMGQTGNLEGAQRNVDALQLHTLRLAEALKKCATLLAGSTPIAPNKMDGETGPGASFDVLRINNR